MRGVRHRLLGRRDSDHVHLLDRVWFWWHSGGWVYDGRRNVHMLHGLVGDYVCSVCCRLVWLHMRNVCNRLLGRCRFDHVHGLDLVWCWWHSGGWVYDGRRNVHMLHGLDGDSMRGVRHWLLGHRDCNHVHGVDSLWCGWHSGGRVYDGRRNLHMLHGLDGDSMRGVRHQLLGHRDCNHVHGVDSL